MWAELGGWTSKPSFRTHFQAFNYQLTNWPIEPIEKKNPGGVTFLNFLMVLQNKNYQILLFSPMIAVKDARTLSSAFWTVGTGFFFLVFFFYYYKIIIFLFNFQIVETISNSPGFKRCLAQARSAMVDLLDWRSWLTQHSILFKAAFRLDKKRQAFCRKVWEFSNFAAENAKRRF